MGYKVDEYLGVPQGTASAVAGDDAVLDGGGRGLGDEVHGDVGVDLLVQVREAGEAVVLRVPALPRVRHLNSPRFHSCYLIGYLTAKFILHPGGIILSISLLLRKKRSLPPKAQGTSLTWSNWSWSGLVEPGLGIGVVCEVLGLAGTLGTVELSLVAAASVLRPAAALVRPSIALFSFCLLLLEMGNCTGAGRMMVRGQMHGELSCAWRAHLNSIYLLGGAR